MTWVDRLRETIDFESPRGDTFSALWRRNERSIKKKLGVFEYPLRPGVVVQDLDVSNFLHPITFYFEGADHDLEAARFMNALSQRGTWVVTHPVRGALTLQPTSVAEKMDPTGAGNYTEVESEWIEPSTPFNTTSTQERALEVVAQAQLQNEAATEQFGSLEQGSTSLIEAARARLDQAVDAYEELLSPVYTASADLNTQTVSSITSLRSALESTVLDTPTVAGQIQTLFQIPSRVAGGFQSRFQGYSDIIDRAFGDAETVESREAYNLAIAAELPIVAALGATAGVAVTSPIETRPQAISRIDSLASLLTTTTAKLDENQALFNDATLNEQYFSQSQSYNRTVELFSTAARYLLEQSFDLAIERRFTLQEYHATAALAMNEYGGPGDQDGNIDRFIETNGLDGTEILLLPPGKEVVVYVRN